MTFVLGLTGSIGMGKSATAQMFRDAGVPVWDADAAVHSLYRGRAVPLVEAAFPGTTRDGIVDRPLLRERVLDDPVALEILEAIVHPIVREEEHVFLRNALARGDRLVLLDIPLLFEAGERGRVDAVAVVSAPSAIQEARVLARPGMTPEIFAALLAKQMPDREKRARAHFLVDSGRGFARAAHDVSAIVRALAGRPGRRLAGRGRP
ncbi:dephospho-CoA kinase [Enterovirga sp.]|uniref:dephospho-CoA kinase n=1 Tax=Enterovirga sp. TaxID=2026350 RepID=UPI002BB74492|nr:dephospho-CoA kinase [Enterovirga sp.]HMO30441.1 dephospho-CoA kinase [Enterovirga sp.]